VSKIAMKTIRASALRVTLLLLATPNKAGAEVAVFLGNAFGHCARHDDVAVKIAACKEAAKMTPYPWILQWVYRELARAQRDHGERDAAVASYARSLAARDNDAVRKEMDALGPRFRSSPDFAARAEVNLGTEGR
jgi:hypothetical protein